MTAPSPLTPRLRRGLAAARDRDGPGYLLWDEGRISPHHVRVSGLELSVVNLFTGRRTVAEIADFVTSLPGGDALGEPGVAELVDRLDDALFLMSPRLREHLDTPVREPACIGCYSADPAELVHQIDRLYTAPGGPGLPDADAAGSRGPPVRAVLAPHIDYGRGGVAYGWAFKELFERTRARLFVIVATSHYSPERFTLTRQDFKTPLGTVATDQAYVDRIVEHYGDGLFDDPLAHVPEHSVELEVVMLQHLYRKVGPIRIVPLLVGTFHDCTAAGVPPGERPDIARMVQALKRAEAAAGEPVCTVISGDLAHIGPKFTDPDPVDAAQLAECQARDLDLLAACERADRRGYAELIRLEGDARRVCGFPPTYLALAATGATRGKLLRYDRYVEPGGYESVSFASMAFEGG